MKAVASKKKSRAGDNLRKQLQSKIDGNRLQIALNEHNLNVGLDWLDQQTRFMSAPRTTPGSERFTLHIPYHETVLNLGCADAKRKADHGISAWTAEHVHLETRTPATSLTLGGPSVYSKALSAEVIGGFAADGYLMHTDGFCWSSSQRGMYLTSDKESVYVRASVQDIRMQADSGHIDQTAKEACVTAHRRVSITAGLTDQLDEFEWKKTGLRQVSIVATNDATKYAMKGVDFVYTAVGIIAKMKPTFGSTSWGVSKLVKKPCSDIPKLIVDAGKVASSILRMADKKAPGQVSLAAKTYASITGETAASVWGGLSAGLYSMVSASVMGGTASVKGLTWGGVWAGVEASLKSWRNVSIGADLGDVKIAAGNDVSIGAYKGKFTAGGTNGAQVTSPADTFLHGDKKALLSAGTDKGFGVLATGTVLYSGRVIGLGMLTRAKVDYPRTIVASEFVGIFGAPKSYVRVKAGEVIVNDGSTAMKISGGKILLA